MKTYPLKAENLPKHITLSEVRDFFDGPSADILEDIEIFSNGSTSTAILVITRPDVAYEFLNLNETQLGGNRITLTPELIEETSITLNGSWLREIEDEDPAIQVEIQNIADKFQLKLDLNKSEQTISLTGAPWRIEQAKASLNCRLQEIIKNRSPNIPKGLHNNPIQPDATGIQSAGNKKSGQPTKIDDLSATNEQEKPASKLGDPQTVDAKSDVEKKRTTELDNPNLGKRRVRVLNTGETKSETFGVEATVSSNDIETDQPKEVRRKRVLVSKPDEMQKSDSSADAVDKSNPVDYPASTQYRKVVRIDMDIHRYLLEHSKSLDFSDSSVTQFQVSEQHIDWVIGNNNEMDLRSNEKDFKRLIDKLRIKCYSAPDEFDFDIFKDFIETGNTNEDVTLIFNSKARSCKIVGLSDDVERTYKWISDISGELSRSSRQKPAVMAKR